MAQLRVKMAAERKLASLRRLTNNVTSKRQPNFLRESEGQQVEDQSRCGGPLHEHCKNKSNPTMRRVPRPRGGFGSGEYALRFTAGAFFGVLSFEEFQEAMKLVKRNVATGRDKVPGTILLFLPEGTQILLCHAVVERVAGREDVSRHRLLL